MNYPDGGDIKVPQTERSKGRRVVENETVREGERKSENVIYEEVRGASGGVVDSKAWAVRTHATLHNQTTGRPYLRRYCTSS